MAFSGSQITRLGLYGGPRGLYGSFAGKAVGAVTIYVAFGSLTRLHKSAVPAGSLEKATFGPSTLRKAGPSASTLET